MSAGIASGAPSAPPGGLEKIALIVRREFMERVRTKSFIIGTVLGPLLLLAVITVPILMSTLAPDKALKMAVVDETGSIYADLDRGLSSDAEQDFLKAPRARRGQEAPAERARRYQLEEARVGPEGREALLASLSRRVESKDLDAYLVVPSGLLEGKAEPTYYGRTVSEIVTLRRIDRVLTDVVIARRLTSQGIAPERVQEMTRGFELQTVKIGAGGRQSRRGFAEEYIGTMVYAMFIYTSVIMYGSALARSLIEEKMNRIVEVLLSSVTPFQLMAGKIVGIGAVGLAQFLIWVASAFGAYQMRGSFGSNQEIFSVIAPESLAWFVLYFVLGYFVYSALFCIVGAMCTSEQEAQSAQMPVVLLIVVPLIFAMAFVRQPGGPASVVMSHVPFFSPIVMFMRLQLLPPPAWEVALNVAALLATIAACVWVAGRVFRVGILMTGKRATIPEIVRWIRAA